MSLMHPIGRSKSRNAAQKRSVRPRLESLEKREVLSAFTVTNLADSGAGSLRAAVIASNNTPGPNTISFPGLTGTINLTSGELDISNNSVTINGPGSGVVSINALDKSRIFSVSGDITAEIDNLSMTHGGNVVNGGAILNRNSTVNLNGDQFAYNHATNDGGAVVVGPAAHLNVGTVTTGLIGAAVAGCTFINDSAANLGGAIASYGFTNIATSTFAGETAGAWGGALFNFGTAFTVNGSQFNSNSTTAAAGAGGAVMSWNANASMTGDIFRLNHSANGGAYAQLGGQTTIIGTTMGGNTAGNGGAIFERADFPSTLLTITGNSITFNQATSSGGGILASIGTLSDPFNSNSIQFNTPDNVKQV
jgi:hypothetical protein